MFIRQNEDGLFLIDDKIYLLDPNNFKIIEIYDNQSRISVCNVKLWKKNYLLLNQNTNVIIFNTKTKKFRNIEYPNENVDYGFTIYQDYMILSEPDQTCLFDLETCKILKRIKNPMEGAKYCIDVIDDTVLSGYFGVVTYLNLVTEKFEKIDYENAVIYDLCANQKNKTFIYGSFKGHIGIVDFLTKEKIYSLNLNLNTILNIECFDDSFCYKYGTGTYIHYEKDNFEIFEDFGYCSFLTHGDVLLMNGQDEYFIFKKVYIPREIKELQKVKMMNNYDIYFLSK